MIARFATAPNQAFILSLANSLREARWPSFAEQTTEVATREEDSHRALHWFLAWSHLQSVADPLPIHRIQLPGHSGYPLRRTHTVTFNLDGASVIAEIREVSRLLGLRGMGPDRESALQDLAQFFYQIVATKVRIPPHERQPGDERVVAIIDYMIDWERYRRENSPVQPLWGQVLRHHAQGTTRVRWLVGPAGERNVETTIPQHEMHPALREIAEGSWFHAVMRRLQDRVQWIEPPRPVPDPRDVQARQQAWEAIPEILSDQPDVWPLRTD